MYIKIRIFVKSLEIITNLSQGLPHAFPNALDAQQHSDLNVVPGIFTSQLPLLIFVQQLPLLLSTQRGEAPNLLD